VGCRHNGVCDCGYDLRGLPVIDTLVKCPECGGTRFPSTLFFIPDVEPIEFVPNRRRVRKFSWLRLRFVTREQVRVLNSKTGFFEEWQTVKQW
jgi:hypothetical protein